MLIVGSETIFTKSEQVNVLRKFIQKNSISTDSIPDIYLDMIGEMLDESRHFVAGALGVKRHIPEKGGTS
ncbi:MAG: hypothetical protein ACLQF0_06855 [Dissulfurispiraceae bacterium]